jgi:hypothetical protein
MMLAGFRSLTFARRFILCLKQTDHQPRQELFRLLQHSTREGFVYELTQGLLFLKDHALRGVLQRKS